MSKWGVAYPDDFDPQQSPRNVSPTPTPLPVLRPLGLGELLDQAIRLYRRNFLKFFGIAAVVIIPYYLLYLAVFYLHPLSSAASSGVSSELDLNYLMYFVTSLIESHLINIFLYQCTITAALTQTIAMVSAGKPISILGAYRGLSRDSLRLMGIYAFTLIPKLGLLIWSVVPLMGWTTGPGMLFFFVNVIDPLIVPVVVLEKRPVIRSIRRSWNLARRRFWWVLTGVVILYIFNYLVVGGLLTLIGSLSAVLLGNPGQSSSLYAPLRVIVSVLYTLLGAVYWPFHVTVMTLIYFDLRVRTEGLDLAPLAEGMSSSDAWMDKFTNPIIHAEPGKWITMKEVAYFASVSIGSVVLILVGLVLWVIGTLAASIFTRF